VVHLRLLPLLAKKIFVKEVKLIKPEVIVIRYADGKTFNFSSLTSPSPPSQAGGPSAPDKSSALALLVSKASIESGKLNSSTSRRTHIQWK